MAVKTTEINGIKVKYHVFDVCTKYMVNGLTETQLDSLILGLLEKHVTIDVKKAKMDITDDNKAFGYIIADYHTPKLYR